MTEGEAGAPDTCSRTFSHKPAASQRRKPLPQLHIRKHKISSLREKAAVGGVEKGKREPCSNLEGARD